MANFIKHLGKAFLIGNIIFLMFLIVYYFTGVEFHLNIHFFLEYAQNIIFSVVIYMANGYLFHYLQIYFRGQFFKRGNFIFSCVLSVITSVTCIFLVRLFLKITLHEQSISQFISSERPEYYIIALILSITVTAIFYGINYYRYTQESKIKEQKIIAGTASAKFVALKNQLDPHFLFNSLNVLTSLIEENPQMAQKFTTSLSKVYRYVLEQKDKELITVAEELKFAKTYMTLLKLRFEDSIVFEIMETYDDPDAKIVPLSLQILLENAVKHNIVTATQPLRIKIYEREGFLVVENNLQPKNVMVQSSGVGLSNIKQRYGLLTKKEFTITKTAKVFSAELPILTKQILAAQMITANYSLSSDEKYIRARKKVQKIKEFYSNLASYCIVIPILAFINYQTIRFRFPWFLFPLFGWGIGLIFHYIEAFDWHPIFGKNWQQKRIKKYMNEF
ncbi:2TM domain-containing protein [Aquimarina sp. ERC-38]|uniref:2TM domain-containing protein n=1 Tax=Aquimarina sp. ERC-38 TaxID=2949996 RepID=UPI002246061D|nr:2TM domain-containing protein [Aquimarina sp. ERC-38]UZO80331.1 2TM domain-containing protein [Aquimarina sp. ERC-38]